jgi:hypothetical protein
VLSAPQEAQLALSAELLSLMMVCVVVAHQVLRLQAYVRASRYCAAGELALFVFSQGLKAVASMIVAVQPVQ